LKASTVILIGFLVLAVCLIWAAWVEGQTKILHRVYDDLVLDNRSHYLPCDRLPTEAEVEEIFTAHAETIRAIEQIHPGNAGVEVDTSTCPGRADLLIWYATHRDRQAIEQILGGDTFFGVPYRLNNR